MKDETMENGADWRTLLSIDPIRDNKKLFQIFLFVAIFPFDLIPTAQRDPKSSLNIFLWCSAAFASPYSRLIDDFPFCEFSESMELIK